MSLPEPEPFPLKRIDHLELWVGNAKQASHYYASQLGLDLIAYRGPETGQRDRASYVLTRDKLRLVLTSAMRSEGPIADHVHRHGDGVRSIALEVDDATRIFEESIRRGAVPVAPPSTSEDSLGMVTTSSIAAYGDTVHTFVERVDYRGLFLPGFVERSRKGPDFGVAAVDHIVANVEFGRLEEWVGYYAKILGFSPLPASEDKDISTDYSALTSSVMQDNTGKIKFSITEPAQGRRESQIDEYLDFYGGPGVQHIALITDDIVSTVSRMRDAGQEFLPVPDPYYTDVTERIGSLKEDLGELRRLGILVDKDDEGYLLQIFTRPVQDRPTLFFEIIQRRGSRGFGKGNFKALFEAVEREHALRGNL
jgi:4-hydroxyphenylpyruvate dioxygenase